jgi:hypothetical protein
VARIVKNCVTMICEKCRNTVVQMDLNQAAIREALKLRRNNED